MMKWIELGFEIIGMAFVASVGVAVILAFVPGLVKAKEYRDERP